MSLTVKDLTHLQKEIKKASATVDKMLDFVDLMNSASDRIEGDVQTPSSNIRGKAESIEKSIGEIKEIVDNQLDKFPVDQEEIKSAANKLLLYHGDKSQVIIWAEQQKANHNEGSYWWKYWQGICEEIHNS